MSLKADNELIDFLESNEVEVVKHSKNVISERLYTNRENSLLGALVDRYVSNKSDVILDLLIGVNDAHSAILFEKMNDHMKHGNINSVCNILFAVVKKQPSWLHKIVNTSLFTTFLKFLKQENDILFMMHGILVLCILLPCVPAVLGPHQGDILEVFVRSATILLNRSGNIHEVWLLHLHVSVYVFFHRLYSMYPNNFLSYLKSNYGGSGRKEAVFQNIIKPMFEFVKFHPDLITETRKSETSREKWKVLQPHDVLAECQKISLDPVDSVREANYAMFIENNDESSVQQTLDSSLIYSSVLTNNDSTDRDLHQKTSLEPQVLSKPDKDLNQKTSFDNQSSSKLDKDVTQKTSLDNLNTLKLDKDVSQKTSLDNLNTLKLDLNQKAPADMQALLKLNKDIDQKTSSTSNNLAILSKIDLNVNLTELTDMNTPPSSRPISPSGSCQDVTLLTSVNKQDDVNKVCQQVPQDYDCERKSSGESITGIKQTLKKTQSNSSIENFVQKPLMLKTWLSNAATHSTPASPKKFSKSKTNPKMNRPVSNEFFRKDYLKHLNSSLFDQVSAQSAPSSPMVSGSSHFNFTETDNLDTSNHTKELRAALSKPYLTTPEFGMLKPISRPLSQNGSRSQSPALDISQASLLGGKNLLTNLKELFAELSENKAAHDIEVVDPSVPPRKNSRSPLALLDEFLQYGSDIHSYQLSRVPLTSQLDTDWTYYGGSTPVDELKILQTQVNFLHVQLLYERYKCEQHCLRNRRLFGSLQKSQCDITELDVLREQLQLNETKVKEVLRTAKLLSDEDKKRIAQGKKQEEVLQKTLRDYEKKNAELLYKLHKTKARKKEEKRKADQFYNELTKTKHQLFNVTHELLGVQPKLKKIDKLRDTIESLRKELFLQTNRQDKLKRQFDIFQLKNSNKFELEQHILSLRNELQVETEEKEAMKADLEYLKLKLHEAEVLNGSNTSVLKEKEKVLDSMKLKHRKEIEVLNERFESCKKTCQSLQSYFTTVYSKLEESHVGRTKSISTSSLSHSPHSSQQHSTFNSHSCTDLCRRPLSLSHHDHSHRHTMTKHGSTSSTDNPFSRTRAASITSVDGALKKVPPPLTSSPGTNILKDDSGIERSDG